MQRIIALDNIAFDILHCTAIYIALKYNATLRHRTALHLIYNGLQYYTANNIAMIYCTLYHA